jgi:hypothetical protein
MEMEIKTTLEIPPVPIRKALMLARMWSKGNTSPLLMEVKTYATLEITLEVSQKIGNRSTSRPSYTNSWAYTQKMPYFTTGTLSNYVHSGFMCNSQELETT